LREDEKSSIPQDEAAQEEKEREYFKRIEDPLTSPAPSEATKMFTLTQETEILHRYQQAKSQKEAETQKQAQEAAEQKAQTAAYWAQRNKPKVVTTRKPHQCAKCNTTIPAGQKATIQSKIENISTHGWTPQFLTRYFCSNCKPIETNQPTEAI
jgi:uncharacterized protein with PIN domain